MLGDEFERKIAASIIRLRNRTPFFATLALHARFQPVDDPERVATAATDGQDIFFNPVYLASLTSAQLDGLLLHEVLHAALLHVTRRRERDPVLWNMAADIVINGIIDDQGGFELPPGALRDPQSKHLAVEELYDLMLMEGQPYEFSLFDLLIDRAGVPNPARRSGTALETYWREAMQRATAAAEGWGEAPAGLAREAEAIRHSSIDWRTYLWRFLVQTPVDFVGFDRRFVGRGLYLETLAGESVKVYAAIDTSGSIDPTQLAEFLGAIEGILSAYPQIDCELYFADTQLYGPYVLRTGITLPIPEGGGGTSFVPFFSHLQATDDGLTPAVCVYLTDGFGLFPVETPPLPVLWVVTPGGRLLSDFPFGETIRLSNSERLAP